jgi:hypothetical protein
MGHTKKIFKKPKKQSYPIIIIYVWF